MPNYEYVCRDCGEHVEVVQSFTEPPLTTCGLCSGALRKVFSAAGIIFKGSGYYVTDSRKAAAARAAGKPSAEKTATGTEGKASKDSPAPESTEPTKSAGSAKDGAGKRGSGSEAASA